MPDALGVELSALAVWRIAVLLVRERGPWELAIRLRECVGIEHDEDGEPVGIPARMPGGILGCVWCASAWLAFPMLALYQVFPLFVAGIAVAGVAVLIELVAGRLQHAG